MNGTWKMYTVARLAVHRGVVTYTCQNIVNISGNVNAVVTKQDDTIQIWRLRWDASIW